MASISGIVELVDVLSDPGSSLRTHAAIKPHVKLAELARYGYESSCAT
jgi:hypothetical protein